LVGADEEPFSIPKDVLCTISSFYRDESAGMDKNGLELVCKLPDTDAKVFGYLQNFIYTGQVYSIKSQDSIPDFSVLIRVWKLAKKLKMAHLQMDLLNCIIMCQTGRMPNVENIKEVWADTKEGCPLRIRLVGWIAEYSVYCGFSSRIHANIFSERRLRSLKIPKTPPPRDSLRVVHGHGSPAFRLYTETS
jgi:hypothetical protein